MVLARLLDRPGDEDSTGLGDYKFEVLPRAGEIIRLAFKDRDDVYRVDRVEHHFWDHTKAAQIAILVKAVRTARKVPRSIKLKIGPRPRT